MAPSPISPLASLEFQLRFFLPARLYALAWADPTPETLLKVFEHLRTLRYLLNDYTPRPIVAAPPVPGQSRYSWQEGTLLFTDLAGFTPLMEASLTRGKMGAQELLKVLNNYFRRILEIVSKSGGDLLEFTGDAILVEFAADRDRSDTTRALRAGLRMQRAMIDFSQLETSQGQLSLKMRVGIHVGRFLAADLGTPLRMMRVMLGKNVQLAKRAEGCSTVGRVCLTEGVTDYLRGEFNLEKGERGYYLAVDDFQEDLGEYDLTFERRRASSSVLFDRSIEALVGEILTVVQHIEPLASYVPQSILKVLVENAAQRQIPPNFHQVVVVFVYLLGLSEAFDLALPEEEEILIANCSLLFSLIHAEVNAKGGVMKNPTYHLQGSDILIFFGTPNGHVDDSERALEISCAIQEIVNQFPPTIAGGQPLNIVCQIGIDRGLVFAGEIGEARGRREFNILGDTVNTAARLMSRAAANQVLLTQAVYQSLNLEVAKSKFAFKFLGEAEFKGKAKLTPIYSVSPLS